MYACKLSHVISGLHYHYGLWGRDISHQSSIYWELRNLVDVIDYELLDQFPTFSEVVDGISDVVTREDLHGLELFLFTDNIVAEGAFYWVTSSNPLLFELILPLWKLKTNYSLCLHMVHEVGKRMVTQSTDSLSCGILTDGCIKGDAFLSFVPLHLSVLKCCPAVLTWVLVWRLACFALHSRGLVRERAWHHRQFMYHRWCMGPCHEILFSYHTFVAYGSHCSGGSHWGVVFILA